MESMACGTPAICSDVAGMPEFVLDGETGYVFDDLATLTDRLRALAADPAIVERLGRRARRQVEREFDYRIVGSRAIEVYGPLIDRAREGAACRSWSSAISTRPT